MLLGIAATALAIGSTPHGTPIRVWDGTDIVGTCNVAVVKGLQNSRLRVRSGPGSQFPRIDSLGEGKRVFTCNEHREWLGVAYSAYEGMCLGDEQGLPITQLPACRTGWVIRRWIEIITG